jgi:hypothetical protein
LIDYRRAQAQLNLIKDVVDMAADNNIEMHLRGGWAMDFFLGQVSRDHLDIDFFGWAKDAPAIIDALIDRGYRPAPGPPPGQQANFTRNGEELSFAWVTVDGEGLITVAGGPWEGEPWPDGMFDGPPGQIGNVICPIVNPLAQIEIKEMLPIWAPGLPVRKKDVGDVALIRAALAGTFLGREGLADGGADIAAGGGTGDSGGTAG